jgi:mono/diheme cytochrome c family protein
MNHRFPSLWSQLLALLIAAEPGLQAAQEDSQRAALDFFEKEVRPLLIAQCYECHGAKKQKGSLRMDNISFMLKGGDSGAAVVPGKPDESLLIRAVRYHDTELQMPPKEQLTDKQVAALEQWVRLGAPWPADEAQRVKLDEFGFTEADRSFWCFQPLAKAEPPAVNSDWAATDIDRFISAKQAELGLEPAPQASKTELVRRLYFTLHGLPPTKQQAESFISSQDPQAYPKLVDELLASPRYGERWAQHWLDLVRFAESDGYNQDALRPAAWPYRDYVVKSLNDDKPYTQFVKEQLAGDEIDPDNPEVLVATSYLRNPIYEYNQRDAKGQYEVVLTDTTDNAGEVFLGLSFGCARCHDHKFDPILQKDYYRLRAFFTPLRWQDEVKLATPAQKAAFAEQQTKWEAATVDLRRSMDAIAEPRIQKAMRQAYEKFQEDIRAMVDKKPAERLPSDWQASYFCERQMAYERERFDIAKTLAKVPEEKARYDALAKELKKFDHLKPAPLQDAFVATDAMNVGPPNLLKTRKGQQDIAPGYLTLLDPKEPVIAPRSKTTGRRSALADWITKPENPLSTRVITNRVWHYLFGKGIVSTPNDLGQLGEEPSHPELLDYLTRRFLDGGWRLKSLHREILLSATFQQTAHVTPSEKALQLDPGNKFLWRFQPRRLDAEQVRDAMLATSGELNEKAGGPSEDGNGTRRSIYTTKKRNSQNELLRSLDAPAGFASTSERQSTTTPTQALLLLNGDWTLARASKLAGRIDSVEDAWQYALGRSATAAEVARADAFLELRSAAIATEPKELPGSPESTGANVFKPESSQERLVADELPALGDDFSVEAVATLSSIDGAAAVRTLASHWANQKDSVEGFGWSLGVTGEKSRFKPRNLLLQLTGEDENGNIAHEAIPSDLRLELRLRYHIAVEVSCARHQVVFRVQELGRANAPVLTSTLRHGVSGGFQRGKSPFAIGGIGKRAVAHQWDGKIDAARLVAGALKEGELNANPKNWTRPGVLKWVAGAALPEGLNWAAAEGTLGAVDPRKAALVDLCHVLLNANEFYYLH